MFRRPAVLCVVALLATTTPTIAQMTQDEQRVLDRLIDAHKQCVFAAATKFALLSNEPADVIRQIAVASCSRQHDALAEGFKRLGANPSQIREFDTFVNGQILLAVVSTRSKSYDDAYSRGDYATALILIRPLAERGDPIAETRLGQMYFSGDGVPKDFGEAAKWLSLGANQGVDSAQACLGVMYAIGEGFQRDFVLSYMWSSLAAAQGMEEAAKIRDETARLMTSEQIADAQKRVRQWMPTRSPTK